MYKQTFSSISSIRVWCACVHGGEAEPGIGSEVRRSEITSERAVASPEESDSIPVG